MRQTRERHATNVEIDEYALNFIKKRERYATQAGKTCDTYAKTTITCSMSIKQGGLKAGRDTLFVLQKA